MAYTRKEEIAHGLFYIAASLAGACVWGLSAYRELSSHFLDERLDIAGFTALCVAYLIPASILALAGAFGWGLLFWRPKAPPASVGRPETSGDA